MSAKHDFQPGDYATETLVTDTRVHEVLAVTDNSVTFRSTRRIADACEVVGPMLTHYPVQPDLDGEVRTRRVRKDGTIRLSDWSRPIRKASLKQFDCGTYPYEFVDYSY